MIAYGDIVVNFLRILSTKSTISGKKNRKIYFHRFQNTAHILGQEKNLATFRYFR